MQGQGQTAWIVIERRNVFEQTDASLPNHVFSQLLIVEICLDFLGSGPLNQRITCAAAGSSALARLFAEILHRSTS